MAKIIDPDSINFAVNAAATTQEIELQTGAKTIKANITSTNLDDDAPGKTSGVTGRALYSALKIEWLANATLRRYQFPIKMIFEGSFIVTNGWTLLDQQTEDVMRDAGFNIALTAQDRSCMVSLGSVDAPSTDQGYYTQATGFTAATSNYDKTGEINENIDTTSAKTYQKSFLREQGKLFAEYSLLVEQGLSTLNFQAYSFPLSNGTDLKVDDTVNAGLYSDANVGAAAEPYQSMGITYLKGSGFTTMAAVPYVIGNVVQDSTGRWFFCTADGTATGTDVATGSGTATFEAYEGEYQIGASYYAFNRKVDCGTGTHRQAYAWAQYQLRQVGDINADTVTNPAQGTFGTVNGKVAELLGGFVGDNLKPKPGVLFFNFNANSTNSIQHSPITVDGGGVDAITFVPLTSEEVAFPFVAAGNINFSDNIDAELNAETIYDVYFEYITTTTGAFTFGTPTGQTVDITWAGTELDHIEAGDYLGISGTTTPANSGEYLVNTVGAGTMNVTHQNSNATLVADAEATFTVNENPFGSLGAVIVNNNAGTPLTGEVTGTSIAFDFDYTNNNQGGRAPDTDAPIRVIALALDGAEWATAVHTIAKATGQNIAVNANDERNYSNPA